MPIKVVPFTPKFSADNVEINTASALESLIQEHQNDGWEFKSIHVIQVGIQSDSAFSIVGENEKNVQCVVFEK